MGASGRSYNYCSSYRGAEPHSYETDNQTEHHVQQPGQQLTLLDSPERLILKRRESGVGADKSNGNQVSPIGACRGPCQQRHKQSDQETATDVDDECAVRETDSAAAPDVSSECISGDGANETSDANDYVSQLI